MSHRYYPIAVLAFWCSTMTWLVVAKVIPGLRRGDPPDHRRVAIDHHKDAPPVVWDMKWNMQKIGWAASKVVRTPAGRMEVLSRIQFTKRPQTESTSTTWLVQQLAAWAEDDTSFRLQIDNRTQLNSGGALEAIDSSVRFNDDHRLPPWMLIQGKTVDGQLELKFHIGERHVLTRSIPMRRKVLIANEISPRGFMPPLRLHQSWTTIQVSPLRTPTSPQQPIVAKVERYEGIIWEGRAVETLLVVYRKDAGSGTQAVDEYLGRMWVRPDDGMVLRQEVVLLGSRLTFIRKSQESSSTMVAELLKSWDAVEPPAREKLNRNHRASSQP